MSCKCKSLEPQMVPMMCPSPSHCCQILAKAGMLILFFFPSITGIANSSPWMIPGDHPSACVISLHNVPDDTTISCADIQNLSNPVTISANADCCVPITLAVHLDTFPGGPCPEVMTLVRTWTATDACGNTQTAQQHLSVIDLTAPVFVTVPANTTVQCSEVPNPPVPGVGIVASDGCGVDVTITMASSTSPGICPQNFTLIRTWTASDICGNTSTASQVLHVVDTQAPQFIDPPADMTIACHVIPDPAPNLEIVDNCAAQIEKTFTETMTGGGDCDLTFIYRTWSTEDQCGNSDTYVQTITRGDTGGPVFTFLPPDVTVECDQIPDDQPILTDDCDDFPELNTLLTTTQGSCPGNYILVKEWTALDDCGYVTTASQMITVVDTQSPTITFTHPVLQGLVNGDTLKVHCQATETFDVNDAEVTDACDANPDVVFIDSLIFDDGCKKLLYCEWRATDHCDNVSSFIFYMLVGDFEAPVLSNVPGDLTLDCAQQIPPSIPPTATDDCDLGPKILFQETTVPGPCPQAYQLIRTWTAVDICGNQSTGSQVISVIDQQPPVITPVEPLIAGKPSGSILQVQCGQEPAFSSLSVTSADGCDPDVNALLQSSTNEVDCAVQGYLKDIVYTWTASDDCQNTSTYQVTVRVSDTIPPQFIAFPVDVTLACDDNLPTTKPAATDNCGTAEITMDDVITFDGCTTHIERTWQAIDDCGNVAIKVQLITLIDDSGPTFMTPPADVTIACTEPVPPAPNLTVQDPCDPNPSVSLIESTEPGNCEGNYTLIRTWTASDACGNTSTHVQKVTVQDLEPPVWMTTPDDLTVDCHDIPSGDGQIAANDACNSPVIYSWEDEITEGPCAHAYTIDRTFRADDGCGNAITFVQHIAVQDTIAPSFDTPTELTLECNQVDPLPEPIVIDLCDPSVGLESSVLSQTPGACAGEQNLEVQWTATDHCGNTTTILITDQVIDTQAPLITPTHPLLVNQANGSTIIVHCDQVPVMDESSVTALDACSPDVTITFEETLETGNCLTDGFIYKLNCIWTAIDDCGNQSTYQVYIEVVDVTPPVFQNQPVDLTIEVKNGQTIPQPPTVQAEDACDPDPAVIYEETTIDQECGYELIRTWTAVDHCGNSTSIQQVLLIDEGCPCQKAHLELIESKDPKYGMDNGMVTIHLVEDEADYEYLWIPNKGTPNAIGNSRANLPAGNYQVYISDPLASASCSIKVNVSLTMKWSCIDTIYTTIPQNDPAEVCVGSVLDLLNDVASASVCGFEPDEIESVTADPQGDCVIIDPVDGFVGTSTICVIHCDNAQPPMCDTTYIIVTLNAVVQPPCADILQDDLITTTIMDCQSVASICLAMSPDDLLPYSMEMDGAAYTPDLNGCQFEDRHVFSLAALPDGGQQGPYEVTDWKVNGQSFNGLFDDVQDLLAMVQQWDPYGDWRLNSAGTQLHGGSGSSQYGPLTVHQTVSGIIAQLQPMLQSIPMGSVLDLEEGEHLLVVTHTNTGCADEVIISVDCIENEVKLIALNDKASTKRNQAVTIPILVNDLIPNGQLDDLFVVEWPANGSLNIQADRQARYQPATDFCGLDTFAYVICNAQGCDTALVCIDVDCSNLKIYTGFSPNGDGINDTFTIDGIEAYPYNELSVWNRWGNLVYTKYGYQNEWGGTWSESDLPDGTYFYILDDGTGNKWRGYLQINR